MPHISSLSLTSTICNLLHSLKIDCETSKMSKVQTYQNVASKVLQVILAIAAKHICKSKEYTYKLVKTIRNNACVIYVNTKLNLVYCFTLHNFTIAKR